MEATQTQSFILLFLELPPDMEKPLIMQNPAETEPHSYDSLTDDERQAYDWLTEQGGLVEMARADRDFYAKTWYSLEAKKMITRTVPEDNSRMYWAIATEDEPLSDPTEATHSEDLDNIPF